MVRDSPEMGPGLSILQDKSGNLIFSFFVSRDGR